MKSNVDIHRNFYWIILRLDLFLGCFLKQNLVLILFCWDRVVARWRGSPLLSTKIYIVRLEKRRHWLVPEMHKAQNVHKRVICHFLVSKGKKALQFVRLYLFGAIFVANKKATPTYYQIIQI